MSRTDDGMGDHDSLVERLADAVLAQNAALAINTRSVDRMLLQLQAATNALTEATNAHYQVLLELKNIDRLLSIISKDVDDAEKATREATGSILLATKKEADKPTIVSVLQAFGAMKRESQFLIIFAIVLLAASGWLFKVLGG